MLDIKENVGKPKERLWKYCLSVKKLLWPFKWYIGFYLIYISLFVRELITPPAENDPIFNAEATSNDWSYESQRVYIGSLKLDIIIIILIFLLGLSNVKNHPKIAKLIFLSPWIMTFANLILSIWEEIFG